MSQEQMAHENNEQVKKMSPKKFAKMKLTGKHTAAGLLAGYRAFLNNYDFLNPILTAYDAGEILPTPTVATCQALLGAFWIEREVQLAQKKIEQTVEKYETAPKDKDGKVVKSYLPSGNYLISLMVKKYDDAGEVVGVELGTIETVRYREVENDKGEIVQEKYLQIEPAIYSEDTYQAAQNKADRLLVSREDSVFCEIENTIGVRVKTVINRNDGFFRQFRKPKQPFTNRPRTSTPTLKWHGKAKQTRSVRVTS